MNWAQIATGSVTAILRLTSAGSVRRTEPILH